VGEVADREHVLELFSRHGCRFDGAGEVFPEAAEVFVEEGFLFLWGELMAEASADIFAGDPAVSGIENTDEGARGSAEAGDGGEWEGLEEPEEQPEREEEDPVHG
jgi:hypothetical protein